jgi:DNA-binding NarL/FixJ family response regulator
MDQLFRAIRTVAQGHIYLHPEMAREVADVTETTNGDCIPDATDDILARSASLSPREREVLRCYLSGMSVSEIAAKFSRSANTISTQKQSAYRKLGIRTDSELFKVQRLLVV